MCTLPKLSKDCNKFMHNCFNTGSIMNKVYLSMLNCLYGFDYMQLSSICIEHVQLGICVHVVLLQLALR